MMGEEVKTTLTKHRNDRDALLNNEFHIKFYFFQKEKRKHLKISQRNSQFLEKGYSKKLELLLSKVEQKPSLDIQEGLFPVMKALTTQKLLWHPNLDVRVFVVSCLNEIIRITAPDLPYDEEQMKEIFLVTRRALDKLYCASGIVVKKAISILHNIAKVHLCSLMLDLECDEIVVEMCLVFFGVIGSDLPQSAVSDMETILTLVIQESDEISPKLLTSLLNSVKKETPKSKPLSSQFGKSILKSCAGKLKSCLPDAVRSTGIPLSELPETVSLICQGALEGEPSVANEMGVSSDLAQGSNPTPGKKSSFRKKEHSPCKNLTRANVRIGKKAIKGEAEPRPGSSKRSRRPNSLMRPEEGYALPKVTAGERKSLLEPSETVVGVDNEESTSGGEEMEELNDKRPRYNKEYGEELVGDKIRVWWPLDQTFSEGTIASFDPISMKHKLLHDDGDEEMLDLREERWELIETTTH